MNTPARPDDIPTYEAVAQASRVLNGKAHRTPILTSRTFDELTGASVFFKPENLQRSGSFKFRGAYNAIAHLGDEERRRGVLAYSSGNHAQGIALAGQLQGVETAIVMPNNAPAVKLAATAGYGAEIIRYDPAATTREALATEIGAERGSTIIPSYDHPHVIAGQGTAGVELFEDAGPLDVLLVCLGGGGLLSGCALAAGALSPGCRVVGVEPAAADDAARSFRSGTLHTVHNPDTIADGARTPFLGRYTFHTVLDLASDIVTVTDDELIDAMGFLWERMKLVVEPTGALATAALLTGKVKAPGQRVGVLISGGNLDVKPLLRGVGR
ncbi:MAG: threo-3-hydroxy-L-aspartate ammonia-lyase [Bacteroidota bacterium]